MISERICWRALPSAWSLYRWRWPSPLPPAYRLRPACTRQSSPAAWFPSWAGPARRIGGPTGAFVVIVAGIVAKFGVSGLVLVTMMAGAMLVVMGLTRLGAAVKFI